MFKMCFEGLKAGRPRLLKILRIRRSCMSFGTFEDFEEILLRARSARHLGGTGDEGIQMATNAEII